MIKYDRDAVAYRDIPQEVINKYEQDIYRLSNDELLNDTINLSAGDSFDGEFTYHGAEVFNLMRKELTFRLKATGFLE
jgi:hypothetical protein